MGSGFGLSLLVPFRANPGDPGYRERVRNFEWVKAYWEEQLPLAEFIHGHDESYPYSKTRAVNDAARRATGDVFVILDADGYMHPEVIEKAAHEIRVARREGRKTWYVPYRRFYRLDNEISRLITWSDPANPLVLPDPPPRAFVESVQTYSGQSDFRAHWYGALIQVMPREAFELVGGMDERFAGWGSEDVAFMRAVDTLYTPHKSLARSVFHLYHPRMGKDVTDRKWAGQATANSNWPLSKRYLEAKGDPARMRALVDEQNACKPKELSSDPKGRSEFASGGRISRAAHERVLQVVHVASGAGGSPQRLPGEPARLPAKPAKLAPEAPPEAFSVPVSEVLSPYACSAPAPSRASVRANQRGVRPVGRLKKLAKFAKGLWDYYVLGTWYYFFPPNEDSPGDDAK